MQGLLVPRLKYSVLHVVYLISLSEAEYVSSQWHTNRQVTSSRFRRGRLLVCHQLCSATLAHLLELQQQFPRVSVDWPPVTVFQELIPLFSKRPGLPARPK